MLAACNTILGTRKEEKGGAVAQQLETVEDFVRVAKALEDPNAKPFEYEVQSFGFCKKCEMVVAYDGIYGPEYLFEKCLNPNCFEQASGPPGRFQSVVLKDDMVPAACKDVVDRLHSRLQQNIYFVERAEQYIRRLSDQRKCTLAQARTLKAEIEKMYGVMSRVNPGSDEAG